MKKALINFFDFFLVDFKFYRKFIGGKWYKVREKDLSGYATSQYWTRKVEDPEWDIIIENEEYIE